MQKGKFVTKYFYKGQTTYHSCTVPATDGDFKKLEFEPDCIYFQVFDAMGDKETFLETTKENVETYCIGTKLNKEDMEYIYGKESVPYKTFIEDDENNYVLVMNKHLVKVQDHVNIISKDELKIIDDYKEPEDIIADTDKVM